MKRPKCTRCGSPMWCEGGRKARRSFGPFGWAYFAHWFCELCGHQKNPRVTKDVYQTLKAEAPE